MGSYLKADDAREAKATDQEWLSDSLNWEESTDSIFSTQKNRYINENIR